MKTVFCYYDDVNYEARGEEELQCLSSLGDVSFVSYAKPKKEYSNVSYHITKRRNYFQFIILARKTIKIECPDIVFLHDNYCANLIPYIKKYCPKTKIVYDMSELYIGGHRQDKNKILSWFLLEHQEYNNLRFADFVIAANIERAYIAKGYYKLYDLPYVFNNVHLILDSPNAKTCDKKFGGYFKDDVFTYLYCGGLCSREERGVDKLIAAFNELDSAYQLIIAGKDDGDKVLHDLLENNKQNNVHYLGRLERSELKYLYQNSDVNVVSFGLETINTIYCASGKLYEGLFEGMPLLLSPNPPHISLCEVYGVGEIVYDDYISIIKKMKIEYSKYKANAEKYRSHIRYEERLEDLGKAILNLCNKR